MKSTSSTAHLSRLQAILPLRSRSFAKIKHLIGLLCWGLLCAFATAATAQTIQYAVIERGTSAQADPFSTYWADSGHGTTCGMTTPPFRGAVVGDWNITTSSGSAVAESTDNCNRGWSVAIGGQVTVPSNAAAGVYTATIHEAKDYKPDPTLPSGFRMAKYKFQVVVLTLTCNNADIMQNPASVMVGQTISLKAVLNPVQTPTSVKWNIGGEKIANYTQTAYNPAQPTVLPKAEKTEFDPATLSQQNPTPFYFINGSFDGSSVSVSCNATVNGKQLLANGSIKVLRPKVDSFKGTWTSATPPVDVRGGYFILGQDPGSPGIKWDAEVTTPATPAGVSGEIFYVQRMNFLRQWKEHNLTQRVGIKSSGAYVLDDGEGVKYGGSEAIGSGVIKKAISHNDSPQDALYNTDDAYSASDQFELYLMYKPANGIPVTLSKLDWNWSGAASLLGATWVFVNNQWQATTGTWTKTAGANGPASPTGSNYTQQPVWNDSFLAIKSRGTVNTP